MRTLLAALPLVSALALTPLHAVAQARVADAAEGKRLAQTWCSGCHMVDPGSQRQASDATPSFAAIARMPSTTSLSLHAFLLTPHPPMPDFRLSHSQIDDLAAYILDLREK